MKVHFFKLSLLALFAILLSASCTKDNDNDNDELEVGKLVAKIDGVDFESVGATGTLIAISDAIQNFDIVGVKNEGLTSITEIGLLFVFPTGSPVMETTYTYGSDPIECYDPIGVCGEIDYSGFDGLNPDNSFTFSSSLGNATITFSSLDLRDGGHARGSFSGTLKDEAGNTVTITEGKFNVLID
jgi:hypothetical protein